MTKGPEVIFNQSSLNLCAWILWPFVQLKQELEAKRPSWDHIVFPGSLQMLIIKSVELAPFGD